MRLRRRKIKASVDGKFHPLNLLRNWLHQALSYMDAGELVFRIFIEGLETAVIFWIITEMNIDIPVYVEIVTALLIAHTINWIFNGNFWALWLFASPGAKNRGEKATVNYLLGMKGRLKRSGCIGGLALYGSAARGSWHTKSDLDVRVIRRKGFLNLICANIVIMRERFLALLYRQPMDLFLADGIDFLRKMRIDENPVFLIKRLDSLESEFPGNDETSTPVLVREKAR